MKDALPNNKFTEREAIKAVHDGRLQIDAEGRIWRIRKWVNTPFATPGLMLLHRPRRAEYSGTDGYPMVNVVIEGTYRAAYASRLVWQYFYGDIPPGLYLKPIDGDRSNSHPLNLSLAEFHGNAGSYRPGSEHRDWTGGRRVEKRGYVRIYVPAGHPMRMADGTVLEHRLVAAKKIGRPLSSSEVGHHENEIKGHNDPSNISVMTRSSHARLHNLERYQRLRIQKGQ
jgi:hypothetical protein